MNDQEEARERFFMDTKNHLMTVFLDECVYRHIRFSIPGSSIYRFDLVTWPGYLAITGDMGSSTFSRVHDMFTFFRAEPGRGDKPAEAIGINPSYWAEKLVAIDRHGWKEFDQEHFRRVIVEQIREYGEPGKKRKILKDAREQIFSALAEDQGGIAAMTTAYCFKSNGFTFHDLFDHNFEKPKFHFLWLLWAIVWGIRQYDERGQRAGAKEAASDQISASSPAPRCG